MLFTCSAGTASIRDTTAAMPSDSESSTASWDLNRASTSATDFSNATFCSPIAFSCSSMAAGRNTECTRCGTGPMRLLVTRQLLQQLLSAGSQLGVVSVQLLGGFY